MGSFRRFANGIVTWWGAATITAALHLALVWAQQRFGQFDWLWHSRDLVFLLPLGYFAAFALPIGGSVVVHTFFPRRLSSVGVGAVATAGVVLGLLLLEKRISPYAWLVVAIGCGTQWYRWWRQREKAHARLVRWSAAATTMILGVTTITRLARAAGAERDALARLATARANSTAALPNVLLLLLDTVRASSLSVYGDTARTTPGLERLATRGVLFTEAFSAAPWTLPSHAALFTGLNAGHLSADWRSPLDDRAMVLAEVLRANGYATGGFVGNLIYAAEESGLGRGFMRYQTAKRDLDEVLLSSTFGQRTALETLLRLRHVSLRSAIVQARRQPLFNRSVYMAHRPKSANDIVQEFLDWQTAQPEGPWFAFLNLFDAHGPFQLPPRYEKMFDARGTQYGQYLGAIRYIDEAIDSLLAELERRRVLDNTIVIVTSDHGELHGEHALTSHGNSLYREELRVPLIIVAPGRLAANKRVTNAVSLRDLAATTLDLVGLPRGAIGGTSLRGLVDSGALASRSPVLAELSRRSPRARAARGDLRSTIDDTLVVIGSTTGRIEAFAYRTDSAETNDLARDTTRVPALRALLRRQLERAGLADAKDFGGRPPP